MRSFASKNQWKAKYEGESILYAESSELLKITLLHGLPSSHRAKIWMRSALQSRMNCGINPVFDILEHYAKLSSHIPSLGKDIAHQIELDLPRTFADQIDYALSLKKQRESCKNSSGTNVPLGEGSRVASAESAANIPNELLAPGTGDAHDVLRRILRTFAVCYPQLGYLQSMNFVAAFCWLVIKRQQNNSQKEKDTHWDTFASTTRFHSKSQLEAVGLKENVEHMQRASSHETTKINPFLSVESALEVMESINFSDSAHIEACAYFLFETFTLGLLKGYYEGDMGMLRVSTTISRLIYVGLS